MVKMVMETPRGVDIEKILEVIVSVLRCRLRDRDEEDRIEVPFANYEVLRSAYTVEVEWADVELLKVIDELKEILPIEVYFENRGNTDHFKGREDGEIEDKAIWRLYNEEAHKRRAKVSA